MMGYKSAVTLSELFILLDLNKDGELSRSDLHESARRLGWHWNEETCNNLILLLRPNWNNGIMSYGPPARRDNATLD